MQRRYLELMEVQLVQVLQVQSMEAMVQRLKVQVMILIPKCR